MFKKFLLILFLSSLIIGCGYSPILLNKDSLDINIISIEYEGDKRIKNHIKNSLKQYYQTNSTNKFQIKNKNSFLKKTISKDEKGNVSSYEIEIISIFDIKYRKGNKTISLNKKLRIKKDNDIFQNKNYENQIIKNLSKNISDDLIVKLSSFK